MRVNSSQLISAGGSSSSKVRGHVSQSRLHRLVTSRYRQTGGVSATDDRSADIASKYRRGSATVGASIRAFLSAEMGSFWAEELGHDGNRSVPGARPAHKPTIAR